MPAVTADPLTLDRVPRPGPTSVARPIVSLTTAPAGFEGEGFPVRRAFAGVHPSQLDPFIHMDQMGEVDYAPGEPMGTSWHPHRGFETVTYMIDGVIQHQDSHGGGGRILDGGTQWMTAGSGILHIETPPEELVVSGGLFHGIQLWVNLPSTQKMVSPAYQDLAGDQVRLLGSHDGAALLRLVAGDLDGHQGPGSTRSPITFVHATLTPGARMELPWDPSHNALVYVLSGRGSVGAEQAAVRQGQLVVLGPGDHLVLGADESQDTGIDGLDVLLLGGAPIGEPVAQHGPFVMNTRAELVTAVEDFQSGRFGRVPPGALQPYRPTAEELAAARAGR
jgi:redox-sensitive bicupin YhaK (pirin superfamily)